MKNFYTLITVVFLSFSSLAQIVNIPDANFKAKLLASNPSNTIAYGFGPIGYMAIDANANGELEVSEAAAVRGLDVSGSSISSLEGIAAFSNVTDLKCQNNNLSTLDVSAVADLANLDCSVNQLSSLGALSSSLININCSYNSFTSLNLNSLVNLQILNCSHNQLATLNLDQINNTFKRLDCSYNNLTSFIVPNFFPFLDMGDQIMSLNCSHNQLSQITFDQSAGREDFSYLDLSFNNLTDLNIVSMNVYGNVVLSNNPFNNLSFSDFYMGGQGAGDNVYLTIDNTNLTQVAIPGGNEVYLSLKNNPNLVSLDLKNGSENAHIYVYYVGDEEFFGTEGLELTNNPQLALVCCDATEQGYVVSLLPGAAVTPYCDLTPGGAYNTITGSVILNCPDGNPIDSNIKVLVNANQAGFAAGGNNFIYHSGYGDQTVTLDLPHPNYFMVTPPNYVFNFTSTGNTEIADFCLAPNGDHTDLEATLLPLTPARPGFNATYKVTYTNNGTQTQSGGVSFNFNDSILDFISATPAVTLQSAGMLTWNFNDLAPFESRSVVCTLNVNSPMETPAVNIGDVLNYSSSVTSAAIDETPTDNNFLLSQTVVGSYDPNDKVVTEGSTIDIDDVGNYLHYMIRFQNSGTAAAENVVVTDTFRWENFEYNTLQMMGASHPYRSTFVDGKLEVIFEGIDLPASSVDEPASHGYVAFKIKPRALTAGIGTVIENKALIYFDFNFPIVTNTVQTTVTALANQQFDTDDGLKMYPNPAGNMITLEIPSEINAISIYNTLGQLVKTFPTQTSSKFELSVGDLKTGTYIVKIKSPNGTLTRKLIKI